jgi:hypothetical protein
VIAAEWLKLDEELMRTLARGMRKRCKAVIKAEGWHTKF